MPASKYKLWGTIGSPVGHGVSASVHVGIAAIAKKPSAAEPNIVINELACNLIARALFLPCPPGILLELGCDTHFCSMNFNLAGQALPPTPVHTVLAEQPELCWGITLFDVLMMNTDRHNQNLSYDRQTKKIQIFDHSRAFLPLKTDIDTVIRDNVGKLGLAAHCLQAELSSMDGIGLWCDRVKALPDYAIEESMTAIREVGFPCDKVKTASDFLKSRRDEIHNIITSNIGQFPKIPQRTPAAAMAPVPAPGATAPGPTP